MATKFFVLDLWVWPLNCFSELCFGTSKITTIKETLLKVAISNSTWGRASRDVLYVLKIKIWLWWLVWHLSFIILYLIIPLTPLHPRDYWCYYLSAVSIYAESSCKEDPVWSMGSPQLTELMNWELVAQRQLGQRGGRMEGSRGGASVVEAWLKGVSMVGLPRNLMLVPDEGKPSSKTREHTHQHQHRACTWP